MGINVYLKSIFWLLGSGGAAYVLMKVTEPSQEKLDLIRKSRTPLQEEQRKKNYFLMQKLKGSANIESETKNLTDKEK